MSILVDNISKQYTTYRALHHVFLEIEEGSLVALIGESGSGKSTLLRILAGLEEPDQGNVWFKGKKSTQESIQNRNVGFVFQKYALFQHMTVGENIGFGLKTRSIDKYIREMYATRWLHLVRLKDSFYQFPEELSGGQKQRVAFARALATEPQLLLLDEPFGALDIKVRKWLRVWLRDLHQQVPRTTVFVTHDHQEALEVADQIIILENGSVKLMGKPNEFNLKYPTNKLLPPSLF